MTSRPYWPILTRYKWTVDLLEGLRDQDWMDLRIMMHRLSGSSSSVWCEVPRSEQSQHEQTLARVNQPRDQGKCKPASVMV